MIYLSQPRIRDGLSTGFSTILGKPSSRALSRGRAMLRWLDVLTASKTSPNTPSGGIIAEHVERLSVVIQPQVVRPCWV